MKNYSVAIVGATGAVGRMMLKVLEEQNFPISELYLLASKRSKNKTNLFKFLPLTNWSYKFFNFVRTFRYQ